MIHLLEKIIEAQEELKSWGSSLGKVECQKKIKKKNAISQFYHQNWFFGITSILWIT